MSLKHNLLNCSCRDIYFNLSSKWRKLASLLTWSLDQCLHYLKNLIFCITRKSFKAKNRHYTDHLPNCKNRNASVWKYSFNYYWNNLKWEGRRSGGEGTTLIAGSTKYTCFFSRPVKNQSKWHMTFITRKK